MKICSFWKKKFEGDVITLAQKLTFGRIITKYIKFLVFSLIFVMFQKFFVILTMKDVSKSFENAINEFSNLRLTLGQVGLIHKQM